MFDEARVTDTDGIGSREKGEQLPTIQVETFSYTLRANAAEQFNGLDVQASILSIPNKEDQKQFISAEQFQQMFNLLQKSLEGWLVVPKKKYRTEANAFFIRSPHGIEFKVNLSTENEQQFDKQVQFFSELAVSNYVTLAGAKKGQDDVALELFNTEYQLVAEMLSTLIPSLVPGLKVSDSFALNQAEDDSPRRSDLIELAYEEFSEFNATAIAKSKAEARVAEADKDKVPLTETVRHLWQSTPPAEKLTEAEILERMNFDAAIVFSDKERLKESYTVWKTEYKRVIQQAKNILIPPVGGLGDREYGVFAGIALAQAYPDKNIYVRLPDSTEVELYDALPSNLHILAYELQTDHIDLFDKLTTDKTVVLNINPEVEDKDLPRKAKEYPLPLFDTNLTLIDPAENRNDAWRAWGYTVLRDKATEISTRQQELIRQGKLNDQNNIAGFVFDKYKVASQIETLKSVLVNLLDIDPEVLPNTIPVKTPERNSVTYDLFIIYDARAAGDAKIADSQQIETLLTELYRIDPTLRVGIANGKDHSIFDKVNTVSFPEVTVVIGGLSKVMSEAWSSSLVLGVDTGLIHELGGARAKELAAGNTDVPDIVELMGLTAPFPADKFKADGVTEVVAVPGLVKDLSAKEGMVPLVLEYLRKRKANLKVN